jgi:DNA-binding SARP family transcriptional activator
MEEPAPIELLPTGYQIASARVLEFRILGPLEVLEDDRPVALGGPKQRAALAILLLSANRVVPIERFADDLYAGAPPVTAVTQVQRQVSELRKAIGAEAIETRSPGYVLHVEPEQLDLARFERWTHDGAQALERSDPDAAAGLLRRALDLWRGAPLADLTYESFAQPAIGRLEELRLAAIEQRFDADLELGRETEVIGELDGLIWDHPLRERFRAQMMLALYRTGRQAEALEHYRRARETLVEELGIEPSTALRELEQRILAQDQALDRLPTASPAVASERTVLVVASTDAALDGLLALVEPLRSLPDRAVIVARLVATQAELPGAAAAMSERRASLGMSVRTAAFTSLEPARDVVRLATNYDVELVVLDEGQADRVPIARHSPADVAVLSRGVTDWREGGGLYVPFGGSQNDWAALELAAWLASAARAPLRLVGTSADPARGRRDSSRLLADASLALQRVVGVDVEPILAEAAEDALVAAVQPAALVVAGLPSRWEVEGLGEIRSALFRTAQPPVVLVKRGTRPGALAPHDSWTRFSWSLEP